MSYVIFTIASLVLAYSFPHWDPTRKLHVCSHDRALGFLGTSAHLGATMLIGWWEGLAAGIAALLLVPVTASVLYTLVFGPLERARRTRARGAALAAAGRPPWHRP